METTVSPEEIPEALFKHLRRYAQGIAEAVDELTVETANQLKNQIKADSPKRTGAYRRGWVSKTISEQRGRRKGIVYNKEKPQLTHLLENGHYIKRKNTEDWALGYAFGKPHIEPNKERINEKYLKKVEDIIRNGGKT